MITIWNFNAPSAGTAVVWTVLLLVLIPILKLVSLLLSPYLSNLRDLPGPPGGSWITGHISDLNKSETDRAACHLNWLKEYGHVFVYKSLLNSDRLVTVDPKALNHILGKPMIYYKPSHLKLTLGQLIGEGLIFAEGAAHKRQRRVMNPTFSLGNIREMTEIFLNKAVELRDSLSAHVAKHGDEPLNAIPFVSRCTLDIVGLAGFNYDFNTIKAGSTGESTNELARAVAQTNRTDAGYATMQLLFAWIPPLRWVMFDKITLASNQAQNTMRRIGKRLVRERKRGLGFAVEDDKDDATDHGKETVFARDDTHKDLLSLMIVANMSPDVSPDQRMTDVEVMHQIPTFMVAGHETTATALTWALFLLAKHPSIQSSLRHELSALGSKEMPSMDELNGLTYFDAVVKECLRLYPSFENTLRVAQEDDIVPLEKPFVNRKGELQHSIRRALMKKGDGVFLPILVMNRLESIWGPDAAEFKPTRWTDLPSAAGTVPSVWGNQFTFLGGPRSCIGYRFAVMEMKAIIYTLIRAFELKLAVNEEYILNMSAIVTRPLVRGQLDKGTQMPLILRPVSG